MPTAAALQFQDFQFQQATPRGTWKWTTRVDVSGPSPAYSIRDILSPYGVLRDSVPLPGIVVQAMADSVTQLQSQFAPAILVSPASLTFTIDEGRGFGPAQSFTVTNGGVFGSLLDVSLTSDAAFVRVQPAMLGGLAAAEAGQCDVAVDSSTLLATSSPYSQNILLQDATATNNPVSLPVTIIVRPKATISVAPLSLTFFAVKPLTGPFPPIPTQSFTISNTGLASSSLAYLVQRLTGLSSAWLASYTPTQGTLAGGASQLVTVGVAPNANCLPGTYSEILRVSGYSTNAYADVEITLVIT